MLLLVYIPSINTEQFVCFYAVTYKNINILDIEIFSLHQFLLFFFVYVCFEPLHYTCFYMFKLKLFILKISVFFDLIRRIYTLSIQLNVFITLLPFSIFSSYTYLFSRHKFLSCIAYCLEM